MVSQCHHIGLLVDDFEQVIGFYTDQFGASISETSSVDGKVDVAFLGFGDWAVEVIARNKRGTYLDELLDALRAVSDVHVAFVVNDIAATIDEFEASGYEMFNDEPVAGIGNYVRAFVHPSAVPGFPVEFIEQK